MTEYKEHRERRSERPELPERTVEFPPEALDREGERLRAGYEVEVYVPEYFGARGRVVAWSRPNQRVLVALRDPIVMIEMVSATCRIVA